MPDIEMILAKNAILADRMGLTLPGPTESAAPPPTPKTVLSDADKALFRAARASIKCAEESVTLRSLRRGQAVDSSGITSIGYGTIVDRHTDTLRAATRAFAQAVQSNQLSSLHRSNLDDATAEHERSIDLFTRPL